MGGVDDEVVAVGKREKKKEGLKKKKKKKKKKERERERETGEEKNLEQSIEDGSLRRRVFCKKGTTEKMRDSEINR